MFHPLIFILSAPAATGKTTLAKMACHRLPRIQRAISCTTRSPRSKERDNVDYHFISSEQFDKRQEQGLFLETTDFLGHRYGTLKSEIRDDKHTIMALDSKGVDAVRAKHPNAIGIFLFPPSLSTLRSRLSGRGYEDNNEQRLASAAQECQQLDNYQYALINRSLSLSCKILESIIIAEEHRPHLQSCPSLAIS